MGYNNSSEKEPSKEVEIECLTFAVLLRIYDWHFYKSTSLKIM